MPEECSSKWNETALDSPAGSERSKKSGFGVVKLASGSAAGFFNPNRFASSARRSLDDELLSGSLSAMIGEPNAPPNDSWIGTEADRVDASYRAEVPDDSLFVPCCFIAT